MLKSSGYLTERHIDDGFGATLSLSTSARQWMQCNVDGKPGELVLTMTTEMEELEVPEKIEATSSGLVVEKAQALPMGERK